VVEAKKNLQFEVTASNDLDKSSESGRHRGTRFANIKDSSLDKTRMNELFTNIDTRDDKEQNYNQLSLGLC